MVIVPNVKRDLFSGHDSLVLEWKYRVSNDIPIDEAAQTQAQELNLAQRQMVVVLEGLYKFAFHILNGC